MFIAGDLAEKKENDKEDEDVIERLIENVKKTNLSYETCVQS